MQPSIFTKEEQFGQNGWEWKIDRDPIPFDLEPIFIQLGLSHLTKDNPMYVANYVIPALRQSHDPEVSDILPLPFVHLACVPFEQQCPPEIGNRLTTIELQYGMATYQSHINAKDGVIISMFNFSPDHVIDEAIKDNVILAAARPVLPPLYRLSDVVGLQWGMASKWNEDLEDDQRSKIRWWFRHQIIELNTNKVFDEILAREVSVIHLLHIPAALAL